MKPDSWQGRQEMTAQIMAASIFVIMFGFIIWEKIERNIVTLLDGGATLLLGFVFCMKDMDAAL